VHKSSRAPSLSELEDISPEKPEYLDREHLKPRRLFESPLPISKVSPNNNNDIDEIISEEIMEDADTDVIPIEARTLPKESGTKELMKNILERIHALEKMSTNQKMRKEIELTLKQLRVLESKFAEYNREHVQSILDDFSAGVNAKLDRFLRERQAEVENDSSHGTKRKLNELTVSLQEQCKRMKLLHRQVTTCIHSAEEVIKECDMQQVIIQNQENRSSRQLDSDVDSLKDEIRTDLEQFKNSLQPLFKGTDFFRPQK
jgi:cysteinyl-tRNA synthetase